MTCRSRTLSGLVLNLLLVSIVAAQVYDTPPSSQVGDFDAKPLTLTPAGTGTVGKTAVSVFRSPVILDAFTGAIIRARTGRDRGSAWFRLITPDGPSEWIPAVTLGDDTSSIRLFAFRSDQQLTGRAVEFATSGRNLLILEAGLFNNTTDDDARSIDWDLSLTARGKTQGKIVPPHLIKRAEWGARPFVGEPIPLARPSYDYITFHHAACCGAFSYEEGVAQVKGIQEFHQAGRGWSDIGYHFVMDQSGRLYQGRPFMNEGADLDDTPILAQGAHAGGANTGNIGLSVLGCYHPAESNACTDVLSPAALDSLVAAIAFLSERYVVATSNIKGHRDFSSTACPGDNNYSILPQIRTMVQELLDTGNAPARPAAFQLSQSFPNPTSGRSSIRYFIESEGLVTLEVYDTAGRRQATLVDEFQPGGRWYTVPVHTDNVAAGLYFYRLRVEGFSGIVFDETKGLAVQR